MSKRLKSIEDASIKLNENLESTNSQTKDLTETTIKLREILSSSQKRGQWGERIVEDILNVIGLMEGVNYTKQGVVESGERPDFTFILPKEKVINMDVKFPLAHYERYIDSDDEHIRSSEKAAFLKDVKKHVRDNTPLDKDSVTLEAGDVIFYFVALLNVLDIKVEDVLRKNMEKLDSREKRDKIKGSGDYR